MKIFHTWKTRYVCLNPYYRKMRLTIIAFCDSIKEKISSQMLIQNRRPIDEFVAKHSDARISFAEWIAKVEAAEWSTFSDVKATFNSADYVKGLVIFNVSGNNFPVATEIVYKEKMVRIGRVGTHKDYDGWKL